MKGLQYKIISTGSKGNAVLVNDVLVDCGVPFKHLKPHLYNVKYLLLTHIHSDHINPTALRNIRKLFPHIRVIGNYEVGQHFELDHIINAGYPIDLGDYTFEAFECVHDVVTYGYTWEFENQSIKIDYILVMSPFPLQNSQKICDKQWQYTT